jgi:amino acid adenylation domain-containing protein
MQAGLVFETLNGRSGDYVQQVVVTCREPIDDEALRRAWLALTQRHRSLRTSFVIGESAVPRQRVHEEVDLGIVITDWRSLRYEERERRWQEFLVADRQAGFALSGPPLMRVAICRLADAQTRLLWTYHHAILDGRSRLALLRELFERYEGKPSPQTAEGSASLPFERFAEWAARRGSDPATEAFWRDVLAGIDEATPAPGAGVADASSVPGEGGTGAISRSLDAKLSAAVRSMASAHRLTPATVLQGVYAMLLSQEADRDDLLFAATRAGRRSAPFDTRVIVGLLMTTSLVRLHLQPQAKVAQWLTRVRDFNLAVRDFEHVPLSHLRRWGEIPRSRQIAESLFSYETASMNTLLRATDPAWERRDVQLLEQLDFPLTLEVFGDERIRVNALYRETHVPGHEAARVVSRYETLLRACVERPDVTVASVCELSPGRRQRFSGEISNGRALAATEVVPTRVRTQILSHPDRIAVEHGDQRLSYEQIGKRTDELAAHLTDLGAGPGVFVGIAMARTPELICALLAVQCTGAAYVPLDPRYPADRLAFMLDDSSAGIVVTDARTRDALPTLEHCRVLDTDSLPSASPTPVPLRQVPPDDLSHLIYTSGSTGQPKAVMVEHRSVAQLTAWAEATFTDDERDGMLASTSLSFDLSVFEILVTLALGGRVVLVENVLTLSAPGFRHDIAFVNSVPSALSELLRGRDLPQSVRTVALAGEALPSALVDRLYAHKSILAVWNLYGPSEDTTYSTAHRCQLGQRPLIGRPVPGTQAYVVDRHLRPVPEGVAGELLLGGLGLARGYLKRPELTAERFCVISFAEGDSARVYRTGDRARWTQDGLLDYLGRLDDQVKIRGVRVEPSELAHVLREQESVDDAAVVVRGEGAGRKLVAYVVGADRAPLDLTRLQSALRARLPAAQLPSTIVALDALPLTPNGKLDRNALPEPNVRPRSITADVLTDVTQRALVEVWRDVLDYSDVIADTDDFFLLGGDSLNALHLLDAIEDRFGRQLSLGNLFTATTLAEQAAAIDSACAVRRANALIPLRPSGSRPPWICVLTDQRGVIGLRNVLPAMLSDQPVYALQAVDPAVPSWRSSSVEQIAAACARDLLSCYPRGPYRLGGHSLGGLVAFHMACDLTRAGACVELLVMLDTLAPQAFRWRGRLIAHDRRLRHESLVRRARGQATVVRGAITNAAALARGERLLKTWPRGFDDPWDQAGANRIMSRYRPPRLAAPVTVLYTALSETLMGRPGLGWHRHVAGPIATRSIPGDHVSILRDPHVHLLAAALADELDRCGHGESGGMSTGSRSPRSPPGAERGGPSRTGQTASPPGEARSANPYRTSQVIGLDGGIHPR